VWIADFIFTRCVTMCPIITAKMNLLRRQLVSSELRFVSFSVEPEYDTPAVLEAYARTWDRGDPRWLLVSPPPERVLEFATAMKMPFEHTDMPDEPILHTTLFFLVDREGWLRSVYGSLDDAAVRRLAVDAVALEASDESAGTGPAAPALPLLAERATADATSASHGQVLYRALGCGACHDVPKLGPALGGLAGRTVRLEGGATVVADDAYLRESILDPAAKQVAGYNVLMPAYRDHLTPADVDALVTHLHALAGPPPVEASAAADPGAPGEPAGVEVQDPVCGMRLSSARAGAHVEYLGKTIYFCSESCRARFLRAPGRYLR
jgi:YHS domain-containing protein/mono/diheme cytochrome c family protein